jgi:hypothetical protein
MKQSLIALVGFLFAPMLNMRLGILPSVGGGYQYGDGNVNEVDLTPVQVPGTAKTGAATLTVAEFTSGLVVTNFGSALALTTPTAVQLDAELENAKVGSSFNFTMCGTGAFAQTLTGGAGVTVVGAAASVAAAAGSATFKVIKTAPGAWSAYRL